MNENVVNKLTYGLFVLTTTDGEKANGCIVNTVEQVAFPPSRISVAVNKNNYTAELIAKSKKFTASVLSEKAKLETFARFGFQSGRDADKFAGFSAHATASNGCEYITAEAGANAYLCGDVIEIIDLGTHYLFIATLTDGEILSDAPPCTYAYYQDNIKPKPEAATQGKTVWVCSVCGYEHEGEELPDDFTCPVCKHPASDFEKVVK
ncbi:MAG: flavin reductase [Clostridia bacterium]|nr:flavin reductase [Clostridia bacterium]